MTDPAPTPMTVEQLLEFARPYVSRPQLGRVEVGAIARMKLTQAYGELASPLTGAEPLGALSGTVTLYGVPIVPRDDLAPDAWRLLDTDGNVIDRGLL